MPNLSEITTTFRAMNTEVTGIICETQENRIAATRALARVELLFNLIERTLSRFQPDSELSSLNKSAGRPFPASGLLLEAVAAALGVMITLGIGVVIAGG